MLHTGYDPSLVALSIAIAVLASYTALDLGGRVRGASPGPRWGWIGAASLAMGGGIWAMHFVGMLAFQMAMPVLYGVRLTVLSFAIAVGATGAAFAWVTRPSATRRDVLVSGPLMGVGVAAMHYTGMVAMEVPGDLAFDPAIVAVSVLIAVTAATVALWLTTRQIDVWQKAVAACVMGLAVAGMHYTGMAAATFTEEMHGAAMAHPGVVGLGQQNLALYVAGATFAILFLGMFASALDQQRIGRDLHASEERFRAAAERVGDIIWSTDARGEMRRPQAYWQRFTGQTMAECQGAGWTAAIHPEDLGPTLSAWRDATATEGLFDFEHRVLRHDGAYRVCSVRAGPVRDRDGTVREWVGVHEDVTERREAEVALRQARDAAEEANLAKSTFLANMSHELRTPLSAIIGYSEMMGEEIADGCEGADLASDMAKVEGNARHLLGLINDVLDLSKIESGKMEVYAEDFDVGSTLREVAGTVESLVGKKGNRLALDLAPDLGTARTDVTKLRQMLLNLLSNAAKFTENGTITLGASRVARSDGEWLRFTVSDTGIGMTPEQLAKLFQRFTQADASTTRKFGGTGLGLSLTRAFADMLGGEVGVGSVAGQGTTFSLSLPATRADEADESLPDPELPTEGAGAGDLVLVIDDDADQRTLLTRFLHKEGFRVQVAGDGRKGLALARRLRPRAILLDVMMPGIDGWSVLTDIKVDPDLSETPVVMVTSVDQRNLADSLGAAEYMVKPVRWDRFRDVMGRFRSSSGGILVVDDSDDARAAVCSMLADDGWMVTEAMDGREGLARAGERRPDVVLLDLNMPVMDGFDFLAELRRIPGCAEVPVVVLTARSLPNDDHRRLRGASQVLNKGDIGMRALVDRLHGLADRVRLTA
ncbi:response regulator [Lichenibacterium minor]|uniref:histidine kinase n=2 Tax=Lichenibacterium minor TaxID=2316528 RepID=A0A4V1RTZ1_9HYPH|nr:response regulator [Lichenibacterium minor]